MSSRHDPPPAATEVIPFPGTESSLGSEEQTPDPRELHIMGILRARAGDLQGGLELLEQAVELAPHVADFRGSVGVAHARSGRIQEAANCFEAALQCDPNRRDYRFRLGDAYLAMGRYLDAESCYQSLLPHLARNARLHVNLGTAQLQLGKMAKAQASYVTATRLDPTRTRAWVSLGQLLLRREPMKAAQCFRRVLEIDPEDPDALAGSAGVRERMGDPEGALAELEPHKHLANESTNIAVTYARVCRRAGMADRAVPVLRASMNRAVVRHEEISLHHALGTTLDSLDEVDHAFDAHERANSLRQLIFDTAGHGERIDALIRTFDPQAFGRIPHASSLSDRPVFIVGMPRSGTSLVEQVLASHPLVYGAGELKSIPQIATLLPRQLGSQQGYPDCIDEVPKRVLDQLSSRHLNYLKALAEGAARVTDKMPHNFYHLGLIALLFPQARVIHCVRDPVDTCLSCYFQNFNASHRYATDQRALAHFYHDYSRLMEHWREVLPLRMMEVQYEWLVEDFESEAQRMVRFLGLEWDSACLEFHNNERIVSTASYAQVNRPIYSSSVGRALKYRHRLQPLLEVLDSSDRQDAA